MGNKKTKISIFLGFCAVIFMLGCLEREPSRKEYFKLSETDLKSYQNEVSGGDCSERKTKKLLIHYSNFVESQPETDKWITMAAKNGCANFHLWYAERLMWYGIQKDNEELMNKSLQLITVNTGDNVFNGLSAISFLWNINKCGQDKSSYPKKEFELCQAFLKKHPSWESFFSAASGIGEEFYFTRRMLNTTPLPEEKKQELKEHLPLGYQILNDRLFQIQNEKVGSGQKLTHFWLKNKIDLLNINEVIREFYQWQENSKGVPTYNEEQKQIMKSIVEETEQIVKPKFGFKVL